MAATGSVNEKFENSALQAITTSPLKEGERVYIGRRTGAVIKIAGRKDKYGFDLIEDYFPDTDTDSEDDENRSAIDPKPNKLKPNQYIGRRTGALIEINARRDSRGFELIEDYFPDSITESETSIESNKGLESGKNVSVSTSKNSDKNEKILDPKEMYAKEQPLETKEMKKQPLDSGNNSQVANISQKNEDVITPQEKEVELSPNLTGTAVKNSATSCEPTPKFFGSKKRLFPSKEEEIFNTTEILDVTRVTDEEVDENIDVTGVGDNKDEKEAQIQSKKDTHSKQASITTSTKGHDTQIVDVEGDDGICADSCTIKPKGSKVVDDCNIQKEKEALKDNTLVIDVEGDDGICADTCSIKPKGSKVIHDCDMQKEIKALKDNTLIIDVEGDDESTFVTLGDKSKKTKVRGHTHEDPDGDPLGEDSYQMDESLILEGTKHKAMSPEFGEISRQNITNSIVGNATKEEMVNPKDNITRKSKKSVINKSFKEHKENQEVQADIFSSLSKVNQITVDDMSASPGKKKLSRKSSRTNKKEKDDKDLKETAVEGNEKTTENDVSDSPGKKRASRKSTRTSKKEQGDKDVAENVVKGNEQPKEGVMTRRSTRSNTAKQTRMVNKSLFDKNLNKNKTKKTTVPERRSTRSGNKSIAEEGKVNNPDESNCEKNDTMFQADDDDDDDDGKDDNVENTLKERNSNRYATRKNRSTKNENELADSEVLDVHDHDLGDEDDSSKDRNSNKQSTKHKKSTKDKDKLEDSEVLDAEDDDDDDGDGGDDGSKELTRYGQSTTNKQVNNTSTDDIDELPETDVLDVELDDDDDDDDDTSIDRNNIRQSTKNKKTISKSMNDGDAKVGDGGDGDGIKKSTKNNQKPKGKKGGNKGATWRATLRNQADNTSNDDTKNDHQDEGKNKQKTRGRGRNTRSTAGKSVVLDKNDDKNKSKLKVNSEQDFVGKENINKTGNDVMVQDGDFDDVGGTYHDVGAGSSDTSQANETSSTSESVRKDSSSGSEDEKKPQKKRRKPSRIIPRELSKASKPKRRKRRSNESSSCGGKSSEGEGTGDEGKKNRAGTGQQGSGKRTKKGKLNKPASEENNDEEIVKSKKKKPWEKTTVDSTKNKSHLERNEQEDRKSEPEASMEEMQSTKKTKKMTRNNPSGNDNTINKTTNISLRKRAIQTNIESMNASEKRTPVIDYGTPYPPGSAVVKSILKSSSTRTQSVGAKKRRVSISTKKKSATPGKDDDGNDDDDDKSINPGRRRKSSVSFAPTPSFRITPDDFSTPEHCTSKIAKLSFVTNSNSFMSEDNTFPTPGGLGNSSTASSISSIASSGSDCSSVNDSQEITISSEKREQIIEEREKEKESGVRRSKRTKIPTLQYWKNERIMYERRKSGWFAKGIERVPTPKVTKRKPSKKSKKEKKKATTCNIGKDEFFEEHPCDFNGQGADMEEVVCVGIPVLNPDTGEEIELDIAHTPEMLNFVNTSKQPAQPEDLLLIDKYMSYDQFGAGQLILRPGAEKGRNHVRGDTMIFNVLKGLVEVTVHRTALSLRAGSTFFVPAGNWYNIKNVHGSDARLSFVQIKGLLNTMS